MKTTLNKIRDKYAANYDMLMIGVAEKQHPERVTVKDLLKFVYKCANDGDDEAIEMIEKMAEYFAERTA